MKRYFILVVALFFLASGAKAQWFDFSSNIGRMDAGINFGQAGSFTDYARLGLGANVCIYGFFVDWLKAEPQHKFTGDVSDTKWHDTVAFCINAGYQVPVLSWLRLLPMAGYAQTNEGITDGSSLRVDSDEDGFTLYHPYKADPDSRMHYFNFGCGLSIQPCKWFSINAVASRYAIYGGISLNLVAISGND